MNTQVYLSDHVWVELTRPGRRAYKKHYRDADRIPPRLEYDHGFVRFHMRDLMYIFGPHLGVEDHEMLFKDNNIRLTHPN